MRGARPGEIGVKRSGVNPPPLWKVMADKGSELPDQQSDPDQTRKHIKSEKKGAKTGSLAGGGKSFFEQDMQHHMRRLASARTTIDNRRPSGMTKGPLATASSQRNSLTRSKRNRFRSPSVASTVSSSRNSTRSSRGSWNVEKVSALPITESRSKNLRDPLTRVSEWAAVSEISGEGLQNDPTTTAFKISGAGVDIANGVYQYDRESRFGPMFRHIVDRRWKLAKGSTVDVIGLDGKAVVKFDDNTDRVDGWYIYNVSDWCALYRLLPAEFDNKSESSERLRLWPPSQHGWQATAERFHPVPIVKEFVFERPEDATARISRGASLGEGSAWMVETIRQQPQYGAESASDRTILEEDTTIRRHSMLQSRETTLRESTPTFGNSTILGTESDSGTLKPPEVDFNKHTQFEDLSSPTTPDVLVSTATMDRSIGKADIYDEEQSMRQSFSSRAINDTFAIDEVFNSSDGPVENYGISEVNSTKSATKSISQRNMNDQTPRLPRTRGFASMSEEQAETLTFLVGKSNVESLKRSEVVESRKPRTPNELDYLDLKSRFSELAMERDIHTERGLRELSEQILSREMNPNLVHIRPDESLRDPLDETKMRAALDELIVAMSCVY